MVKKRIQSNFLSMATGCILNPALRHQRGRPRGARHGKTEAQKEHHVAHNARKRCIKRKLEFTIVSNEIQYIVIFNSKFGWRNWHRKTTPTVHPLRSVRDIEKLAYFTEQIRQICTDEIPIRLPNSSHNYEPSPPRICRRTA